MNEDILVYKIKNVISINEKKIFKMFKSMTNSDKIDFNELTHLKKYFEIIFHLSNFKLKSEISKIDFINFSLTHKNEILS